MSIIIGAEKLNLPPAKRLTGQAWLEKIRETQHYKESRKAIDHECALLMEEAAKDGRAVIEMRMLSSVSDLAYRDLRQALAEDNIASEPVNTSANVRVLYITPMIENDESSTDS